MWTHTAHDPSGYDPNRPEETAHLFRAQLGKDMARLDLGDEEAGDCLASLVEASLVAEPPYNPATAWVNMPLTQVQDPPHRRVEKRAASPLDASDNCKKKPSINKTNAEKCHNFREKQKVKLPGRPRRSYQASLTCTPAFRAQQKVLLEEKVVDLQATVESLTTWSKDIERQRDELVRAHPLTPFFTHETQSRGRLHAHGVHTRMAFTRAVAQPGGDWRNA